MLYQWAISKNASPLFPAFLDRRDPDPSTGPVSEIGTVAFPTPGEVGIDVQMAPKFV